MKNHAIHVVLFAHGSSDGSWKLPFENLRSALEKENSFILWSLAYMEFSRRDLAEVCETIATIEPDAHVVVIPIFLSEGGHTTRDVPYLVEQARHRFPNLKISLKKSLGTMPEFWKAVETVVTSAVREEL